jgi:hypothetical protein
MQSENVLTVPKEQHNVDVLKGSRTVMYVVCPVCITELSESRLYNVIC